MNIKHLVVVGSIAVTCTVTSVVLAEGANFTMLDANGDSYISMEEADKNAMLKDSWDAVDVNKDGKVEKAEFSAFEEKAALPAK